MVANDGETRGYHVPRRLEKRVRFRGYSPRRQWRWARDMPPVRARGYAGGCVTGVNRCGGCSGVETPIEVITEPKMPSLISSQPLARLNAKMKNAIDPREIAHEERRQKAAPGSTTVDADGTSKSWTAPPSENTEDRDGEKLKRRRSRPRARTANRRQTTR
jgi:hypothetical protein